jgi:hypothetical protein
MMHLNFRVYQAGGVYEYPFKSSRFSRDDLGLFILPSGANTVTVLADLGTNPTAVSSVPIVHASRASSGVRGCQFTTARR